MLRFVNRFNPLYNFYKSDRSIFILMLANILDSLSLMLFITFLPIFSVEFFPDYSQPILEISGFLIYFLSSILAIGAAIILGFYGDLFHKLGIIRFTLLSVGASSIAIACIPTYKVIGVLAPLGLLFFKTIQSINLLISIMATKIVVLENCYIRNQGKSLALLFANNVIGTLLAMLIHYFFVIYQVPSSLWRLPFFLVIALFIIARMLHNEIKKENQYVNRSWPKQINMNNISSIIAKNFYSSILTISLSAVHAGFCHVSWIYLNKYLLNQEVSMQSIYRTCFVSLLCSLLFASITGILYDKKKLNLEKALKLVIFFMITTSPILFGLLSQNLIYYPLVHILLNAKFAMYACIIVLIMFKIFPKPIRFQGIMISYIFGWFILGGITPVVSDILGKMNIFYVGIYLSLLAMICLIIVQKLMPNLKMKIV